jgi:hypothetical protein
MRKHFIRNWQGPKTVWFSQLLTIKDYVSGRFRRGQMLIYQCQMLRRRI